MEKNVQVLLEVHTYLSTKEVLTTNYVGYVHTTIDVATTSLSLFRNMKAHAFFSLVESVIGHFFGCFLTIF